METGVIPEKFSDFTKNEKTLAKEWHVEREEISRVRHGFLRLGIHFQTTPGNVFYSELGIEELRKYISPKEAPGPPMEYPRSRCVGPTYPLSETIVAVDRIWANPTLLRVVNSLGETWNLRVGSNKKFRRGMRINMATQVRHLPKNSVFAERYEFSDALPRFNGRW